MFTVWRDGIRRVWQAPAILLGAWAITLLVSLPFAAAMKELLQDHLGGSLAAETAASGVNFNWMEEFTEQARGLGATFRPAVVGFAAVVDNVSAFLDGDYFSARDEGRRHTSVLVGAAVTYILLWMFLAGGALDRYARARVTYAYGFFAASGVFFFRFLRLAILMGIVYVFMFGSLHPWMFETLYPRLTHEISVERTVVFIRFALYALFGGALVGCNIVFDYAKVRAVVEDRRSMLGATTAALRFVSQNLPAVLGLYLLNVLLFLVALGAYAVVAPGAGGTGWSMWLGVFVGQLFIVARVWVKLAFWASETALFQRRAAHAMYVAAPATEWPDSPMAESVGR
jgi:hypothetical protein